MKLLFYIFLFWRIQAVIADDSQVKTNDESDLFSVYTNAVIQTYRSILHRDPEPEALTLYAQQLTNGKDIYWLREVLRNSVEGRMIEEYRRTLFFYSKIFAICVLFSFLLIPRLWRKDKPLQKWAVMLYLLLILNGIAVSIILQIIYSRPEADTALTYAFKFAKGEADNDSWYPMRIAVKYIRDTHQKLLYSNVLLRRHIKFQYSPSTLLFFDMLQRFTDKPWPGIWIILNFCSWLCVLVIGVCTAYLLLGTISDIFPTSKNERFSRYVIIIISIAITITYYPLTRAFHLGQIQTILTFMATLSLIAWRKDKPAIAGGMLGLCCVVKPQFIIAFLWGCFRKQWKFVIFFLLFVGLPMLLSIFVYGLNQHGDYLKALAFINKHGESFWANQSVNGLMHRLLFNGNNTQWEKFSYAPFNQTVYITTIVSNVIILGVALLWRIRHTPSLIDFAIMVVSLTIASPIAWDHYYGILLPIFAIISPILIHSRSLGKCGIICLLISFVLTSQLLEFTNQFASSYLNILQSYIFIGAVILLTILHLMTKNQPNK